MGNPIQPAGLPASGLPGSARILIIDDDPAAREYLRSLLSSRWTVEAAADGDTALTLALAHPPDLVVTDVVMPGLDGLALLRRLRADPRTQGVPVILVSANAESEATVAGLEAGADDHLVKPFPARELMARVDTHLRLRRLREAEAANRAKDEFLAVLGHELRNPLSPIVTALELMRLRGGDAFLRERAIIERQVRHLVSLVSDLLDVSRVSQGKLPLNKRPMEMSDVVFRAIEMASPLVEQRGHRLTVRVPETGLLVEADETRLAQVICNILNNAAKYTPEGGRIDVTAEREPAHVALKIKDSGIGLRPEVLSRIFDLFVQEERGLDRSRGGLGIGLSIARGLVELHGGTVAARSDGEGKGSEFVIRLPLAGAALAAADGPDPACAEEGARLKRILVVDDNVDGAELLDEVFRALGHATRLAHDGPAALQVARDFRPHIAFLDIGLPVMDGYQLARRLRALPGLEDVRLVAVTGFGQEADRVRAREAGFDEHLVKPVEIDGLRRLMDRLLTVEANPIA
jgi:signal transduction histidine kinase